MITLGYLLPDVYTRHDYTQVASNLKVKELFSQLSRLTNKKFDVDEWTVQQKMYTIDELPPRDHLFHQCICSCTQLQKNFIIKHTSGISCTIGSECIHHFGDQEMSKVVRALENHDTRCIGNNLILDKRTKDGRRNICGDKSCDCVLCTNCNNHRKLCTCKHCIMGNLIKFGNSCGKFNCPCFLCLICNKNKCSCNRCIDCKIYIKEEWKSRCIECFKNKKVKCIKCDKPLCINKSIKDMFPKKCLFD